MKNSNKAIREVKKATGKLEQHRQAVATAMPDVRELVKKHGLTLVNSCLVKLREHDKTQRRAAELRAQADKLERELQGEKDLGVRSA